MNHRTLIEQSKVHLATNPGETEGALSTGVFAKGAQWMCKHLNLIGPHSIAFDDSIAFGWFGFLKYGCCIFFTLIAAILLYKLHPVLMLLSIVVFYVVEVHFLFLFPLLIDRVRHPILTSIRITYQIGIWTAIAEVMPIAVYMVAGLFRRKQPLYNWHIGALAIIIWYQHEVRNRLP